MNPPTRHPTLPPTLGVRPGVIQGSFVGGKPRLPGPASASVTLTGGPSPESGPAGGSRKFDADPPRLDIRADPASEYRSAIEPGCVPAATGVRLEAPRHRATPARGRAAEDGSLLRRRTSPTSACTSGTRRRRSGLWPSRTEPTSISGRDTITPPSPRARDSWDTSWPTSCNSGLAGSEIRSARDSRWCKTQHSRRKPNAWDCKRHRCPRSFRRSSPRPLPPAGLRKGRSSPRRTLPRLRGGAVPPTHPVTKAILPARVPSRPAPAAGSLPGPQRRSFLQGQGRVANPPGQIPRAIGRVLKKRGHDGPLREVVGGH